MSNLQAFILSIVFFVGIMFTLAGVYLVRTAGEGAWVFLSVGVACLLLVACLCVFVPAVRRELFGSGF